MSWRLPVLKFKSRIEKEERVSQPHLFSLQFNMSIKNQILMDIFTPSITQDLNQDLLKHHLYSNAASESEVNATFTYQR